MEALTLDLGDWNEIFAQAMDFSLERLAIPRHLLQLDPQATEIMDGLGLDSLVLGASLTDRWVPEAGTDSATWTFALENAGEIELSYVLAGITIDWMMRTTAAAAKEADGSAALMAMLNEIALADASLKVTDRSLLDRAFAVAAQKQGLTVDGPAYRQQLRAALPFLVATVAPAEFASMVSGPLQAFMAGGQTLVAEIAPPQPALLMDLISAAADPFALADSLNLSLRTEAAAQ
jgi:hypothetical protein